MIDFLFVEIRASAAKRPGSRRQVSNRCPITTAVLLYPIYATLLLACTHHRTVYNVITNRYSITHSCSAAGLSAPELLSPPIVGRHTHAHTHVHAHICTLQHTNTRERLIVHYCASEQYTCARRTISCYGSASTSG